jgi:hypothetical protein
MDRSLPLEEKLVTMDMLKDPRIQELIRSTSTVVLDQNSERSTSPLARTDRTQPAEQR